MNEVRRFLRYTLPGIACTIQLLIALSISDLNIVSNLLLSMDNKSSIGVVLAAFLASGGIGYLFAILYFSLYWSRPFLQAVAIDHKILFQDLSSIVEIKNAKGDTISIDALNKKEAWKISTRYWFSKYKDSNCIKGINSTMDRLVDVTHALGATIIGSIITMITWLFIHHQFYSLTFTILVIWIIFVIMMMKTYWGTLKSIQSLSNSTLTEVIKEQYRKTGSPVIIWYSK